MFPVARILERAVQAWPERLALSDGERRFTYAQMVERSRKLAGALTSLGLKPGDRVAILDANSFRYVETYYACALAGLVIVPLNSRLAPPELEYMLNDVGARVLLTAPPFFGQLASIRGSLSALEQVVALEGADQLDGAKDYEALLAAAPPLAEPVDIAPGDTLQIYYTGGTTGMPKGVCLTHECVVLTALDSILGMRFAPTDVWLHAAPLFHLADAWSVWCLPMVGGRQVVAKFDPELILRTIAAERVTKTVLPTTLLNMFASHPMAKQCDLTSLDLIMFGGSPTPLGILQRAQETVPCGYTHCYGITECGGVATLLAPEAFTSNDSEEDRHRQRSAGHPSPHIGLAVLDDDLKPVAQGEVGEIALSGPRIMKEYWGKPQETAAALRGGWYLTGDLGYVDAGGYVHVIDRKKDMIITGGENVYPIDVENVLSAHPQVLEVAVIGLPDARWGEAVTAIVVPREGDAPDAAALTAWCRERIASYKVPKRIVFSAEPLPKTGPSKVAKRLLRERYGAAPA
jgi:long-chain acyl-CoA synthetase